MTDDERDSEGDAEVAPTDGFARTQVGVPREANAPRLEPPRRSTPPGAHAIGPSTKVGVAETMAPGPTTRLGVGNVATMATMVPPVAPVQILDARVQTASGATAQAPLEGRLDQLAYVLRDNYEIIAEFGRGGLGRVLRARDRRTGRIVAIKEALRPTPGLLARFAREAIVTANLQHPAIVPVYEVGRWPEGEPFYAMKLVAGRSLADASRKAATVADRLALLPHVLAVADALAYAHGQRVIHRDLKPGNVLIGDFGETVVIDWGLAKRLDDVAADELLVDDAPVADGKTMLGSVLGTPGYMPPEQARGDAVDERSDVYAIGAMLYEVLSGARPFGDSDGGTEVLKRVVAEPPRPLAALAPEIPADLVSIVERAMDPDPEKRYRTAQPLADDLTRYTTGQLVGARSYSAWELVKRWVLRHRAVVAVASAAIVVLAIVGTIGLVRIRHERDRALAARRDAEDRAAALAEEQGRQLTVSGDAPRGLPFLADAIARGRDSHALRFVLARALDRIAGVEAVLVGSKQPVNYVSYSPDGAYVVAAGDDVRVWDVVHHTQVRVIGVGEIAMWSPDNTYIATGNAAHELELRDPKTNAVIRKWPALPDGDAPLTIAISRDGKVIALGGDGGHLAWYRADGKSPPAITKPHTKAIDGLAFSDDGTLLGAASQDHTATVWDLATATQRTSVKHVEPARDVMFAADGQRFITGSVDGTVIEWDLAGKQLHTFAHANAVESARYDRDATHILVAGEDHLVTIWTIATGTKVVVDAKSPVIEAKYDPSGQMIAARTERGDIFLWSATGAELGVLSGHVSSIGALEWSPRGDQLASGGLDGDVRLWRARVQSIVELPTGTRSWRGGFSPDGTKIAVTGADGLIRIFDGVTGALKTKLAHDGELTYLAWSPTGELASASADGTVKLWNLGTGSSVTLDAHAGRARSVSYSHDGTHLATTHDDGTLHLWDAITHAPGAVLKPPGKARRGIWSPDDAHLLVPLDDGGGGVVYSATGEQQALLALPGDVAITGVWRSDGREFALAANTTSLAHYDVTGKPLGELVGHTLGPINAVDYAPDGATLASAGGDGFVRIWRGNTQQTTIGDAAERIGSVSYRADGALLATGGLAIDIFDPATGQLLGVIAGHPEIANSGVTELHWSPDGTRLLILSISLPPRLWTLPEWHGDLATLTNRLRCALREKLSGSRLVSTTPDASACAAAR